MVPEPLWEQRLMPGLPNTKKCTDQRWGVLLIGGFPAQFVDHENLQRRGRPFDTSANRTRTLWPCRENRRKKIRENRVRTPLVEQMPPELMEVAASNLGLECREESWLSPDRGFQLL